MKILVLTSVFPNGKQPGLGVFVRERMFKVARHCELKVVAPVPWFPGIHLLKPGYRPQVPFHEVQEGVEVYHPRFFNIPRYFKCLDGLFFFLSAVWTLRKIRREFDFDLIDAHFAYPDGLGAMLLGQWFRRPVTITIRGTIRKFMPQPLIRPQLRYALRNAARVFAVCDDLRQAALEAGAPPDRTEVVANGIDAEKFRPLDRDEARRALGIERERPVLISVGGLVERKGFHRVIEVLPELRRRFPDILYLIVGGPSVEGNNEALLRSLVAARGLEEQVRFVGPQPHDQLYRWLSAADVFCLATSNEGWANVFLEAMACGLPVVTTRVGGNPEVVSSEELGMLVPFGDAEALRAALETALTKRWDRALLVEHARQNSWARRVDVLLQRFQELAATESGNKRTSLSGCLPKDQGQGTQD